jgi:hypothetical protein
VGSAFEKRRRFTANLDLISSEGKRYAVIWIAAEPKMKRSQTVFVVYIFCSASVIPSEILDPDFGKLLLLQQFRTGIYVEL